MSLFQTLAKMAVAEEGEDQDPEGHEEEVKVEVPPQIHRFRKAGVQRNHRTWRVTEGLAELKEEGDLITDLEGHEEEGVSFHVALLSEKYVKFDWPHNKRKAASIRGVLPSRVSFLH